jgi:hypothetical protein
MKKIFLPFFLPLLFIVSCQDLGKGIIPPEVASKYPVSLNSEWEYHSQSMIEYYDSTGKIARTETIDNGNTIIRVLKTNDSLGTYKNLILFECYDLSAPLNRNRHWYSNTDTGFISIAYSTAGATNMVYPKISGGKRYLTVKELKSIINSPEQNFFSTPSEVFSDSVQYYEIPRKVLAYPLVINKRWVELILPFYRERYVEKIVNINFNGQPVSCYEIKIDWPGYNIEFNDFVSLNNGLMKREIIADSVSIATQENPEGNGFANISEFTNLVRYNK